jgi:hypothetical protein
MSKHLANSHFNASEQGTKRTIQDLPGLAPPWGYVHQLFFSINIVQVVTNTEPPNPIAHRTKDLCSSLDPSSLPYNKNHSMSPHKDLH